MAEEKVENSLVETFQELVGSDDKLGIREFLNDQNISDVAQLINEMPEYESSDRKLIDQTLLHDYIFEWGGKKKQCCMALGWIPLYNHSYQSNCEYEMDYKNELIQIITVRAIKQGEELFINYNGVWNNQEKVWFETR